MADIMWVNLKVVQSDPMTSTLEINPFHQPDPDRN